MKVNTAALIKRLDNAAKNTEDEVARRLKLSAEDLLSKSIPLTPREYGDLRASGNVTPLAHDANGPFLEVGFDSEYALAVHEMLGEEIDWTTPGTGPKYLETPLEQNRARYVEYIKDGAREMLRG